MTDPVSEIYCYYLRANELTETISKRYILGAHRSDIKIFCDKDSFKEEGAWYDLRLARV